MKTVTMLEFRRGARNYLRRLANGERFVLSHRGKAAARLEPVESDPSTISEEDPFLNIGARAMASPKGKTDHRKIDQILYGRG